MYGAAPHRAFAKWIGLAAVLAPLLFILSFTIGGLLRRGYSPIHQAISDLGVGARPWLLNIPLLSSDLCSRSSPSHLCALGER